MIESRMLRDARARRLADAELQLFVALLVDALDIPEVAAAVRTALQMRPPPPSPSGRGRH